VLIYNVDISQTASSGAWSFNTPKIDNGLLKQIILESATGTTTFNFKITDERDLTVYNTETSSTGKLREELEIPLKGIHTLAVDTSSVDELFTGKLLIQEC
jgi:hypothetical protein